MLGKKSALKKKKENVNLDTSLFVFIFDFAAYNVLYPDSLSFFQWSDQYFQAFCNLLIRKGH